MSDEIERIRGEHARELRLPSSYTADIGCLLSRIDELEADCKTLRQHRMEWRDRGRAEAAKDHAPMVERLRAVARWLRHAAHADSDEAERDLVQLAYGALDALHDGDM